MPNLVVYVPRKLWDRIEEEMGAEWPAWARQVTVKHIETWLSEADVNGVAAENSPPEGGAPSSDGSHSRAPVQKASVSESRPTPDQCGMGNRHRMRTKQDPCPRCGYPA